jgi:hypothetical protein
MQIDRDTAYWRQDDESRHTLVANGKDVLVADHGTHTLSNPSQPYEPPLAIARSVPLFNAAESRLNLPTLPVQQLPGALIDARAQDIKLASLHAAQVPRRRESQQAIQQALGHLDQRAAEAPLSSPGDRAQTYLRITSNELTNHNGRWTDKAHRNFKEAGYAFEEFLSTGDRREQLARTEYNRAQTTMVHSRSINDLPDGALKELERFEREQRERDGKSR